MANSIVITLTAVVRNLDIGGEPHALGDRANAGITALEVEGPGAVG
jgi:hypothetical protein